MAPRDSVAADINVRNAFSVASNDPLPGTAAAGHIADDPAGAWNDSVGKLQLVYDLDRIRALLPAGEDVFDPRDRDAFERPLHAIDSVPDGCAADRVTATVVILGVSLRRSSQPSSSHTRCTRAW